MGLFKPAWQSKNKKKALGAIEKISEQSLLIKIAGDDTFNTSLLETKKAAMLKITDEQAIKQILEKSNVRIHLIEAIHDDDLRNWATFMYISRPNSSYVNAFQTLLEINREELLLELVERFFSVFKYGNAEYVSQLLHEKSYMHKFCDALLRKWFEINCRILNDYGAQMEPGDRIVWNLSRYFRDVHWAMCCPS